MTDDERRKSIQADRLNNQLEIIQNLIKILTIDVEILINAVKLIILPLYIALGVYLVKAAWSIL